MSAPGPAFLTTIPEDVSVAASTHRPATPRSIADFSTASAVASSDSGDFNAPTSVPSQQQTDGRRKRRQGGSSARPTVGGGDDYGDNVSDTHASLGGAELAAAAAAAATAAASSSQEPGWRNTRAEESRKTATSADLSWLFKCTRKSVIFYAIVLVLFVIISIGVYFIVVNVGGGGDGGGNNSSESNNNVSGVPGAEEPTQDPRFPPFYFIESEFPTVSPSYNQEDILATDLALLQVEGTTETNLYDPFTPQGMARYWMIYVDQEELRVDQVGEARVQQRYIACVLYYATSGANWSGVSNYLDPTLHECDWDGITCNTNHVALINLSEKNLTGTLPLELLSLGKLEVLKFLGNSIGGTIPEKIFDSMEQLVWLDLSQNMIGGTIPAPQGSTLPAMENLYLRGNDLEGTVPFFPNIRRILVEENELFAFDPRYATSAQSMTDFIGYDNEFSGPLPTVWNAPNLERLDVGLNRWTGTIPQSLWDLPALKSLIIDSCDLTGELPSSTTGTNFQHVWLHSNLLEGAIPPTFGTNWIELNSLLLHGNWLTGAITDDQCDQWAAVYTSPDDWRCEADCNLPILSCACCTECYPAASNRKR